MKNESRVIKATKVRCLEAKVKNVLPPDEGTELASSPSEAAISQ